MSIKLLFHFLVSPLDFGANHLQIFKKLDVLGSLETDLLGLIQ